MFLQELSDIDQAIQATATILDYAPDIEITVLLDALKEGECQMICCF